MTQRNSIYQRMVCNIHVLIFLVYQPQMEHVRSIVIVCCCIFYLFSIIIINALCPLFLSSVDKCLLLLMFSFVDEVFFVIVDISSSCSITHILYAIVQYYQYIPFHFHCSMMIIFLPSLPELC